MKHNNIAGFEDERIVLCDTYNSASIEFDLSDAETFIEEVMSNEQTYMQAEQESIDLGLLSLRTLMDINTLIAPHITTIGSCFTASGQTITPSTKEMPAT